jgi:hypothetical protein
LSINNFFPSLNVSPPSNFDKSPDSRKTKKELTGLWACGNPDIRPITFKGTSIILNWSFYKLEFIANFTQTDLEIFLPFYDGFMFYGEWGEEYTKPIAWMKVISENIEIQSKSPIKTNQLRNILQNATKIELSIAFEPILHDSPLRENYFSSNSYWINTFGGLYNIVDLLLYIDILDEEEGIEGELYHGNLPNYQNENWREYSIETGKTAIELCEANVTIFNDEHSIPIG